MSSTAPGLARRVTDLLEPKNWIIALTLAIGWQAGHLTGVAWGCFGALFAAIGPIAFIKWGMRTGRWSDRHVGVRTHRLIVMIVIIASVATAITVMIIAGAPREMTALITAMLTTLAALMAITTAWKISVHSAVSAGAAAMLAITFGPLLTAAYALVALVGWSRVALGDHTRGQVIAGVLLGTAVAAATYATLS